MNWDLCTVKNATINQTILTDFMSVVKIKNTNMQNKTRNIKTSLKSKIIK